MAAATAAAVAAAVAAVTGSKRKSVFKYQILLISGTLFYLPIFKAPNLCSRLCLLPYGVHQHLPVTMNPASLPPFPWPLPAVTAAASSPAFMPGICIPKLFPSILIISHLLSCFSGACQSLHCFCVHHIPSFASESAMCGILSQNRFIERNQNRNQKYTLLNFHVHRTAVLIYSFPDI